MRLLTEFRIHHLQLFELSTLASEVPEAEVALVQFDTNLLYFLIKIMIKKLFQ